MLEEIENKIDQEYEKMEKNQILQEEVNKLNKSLTACIEIVSSSISNQHTLERLEQLREDNTASYNRIKNDIDEKIENVRDTISQLKDEEKKIREESEE